MSDLPEEFSLSVFKRKGNTPILAGCSRCGLKFLTPENLLYNAEAARKYLLEKYNRHRCPADSFTS